MRIIKLETGFYKVIVKSLKNPFYTASYDEAIEIAWRLGGGR